MLTKMLKKFMRRSIALRLCIEFLVFASVLGPSCSDEGHRAANAPWQQIQGRDMGDGQRELIYRAKVPSDWQRIDSQGSVVDTMKPLCTYTIPTPFGDVALTIHNFPDLRIPPLSQIERWTRQFDEPDLASAVTTPQAFGGFAGLHFEGSGLMRGERTTIIGWAMQLAGQHAQSLHGDAHEKQKSADYTLKVKGAQAAVSYVKEEILLFALSFGLIDEIPQPL